MILFLIASLPLFFLLVLWLPWEPRKAPDSVEMLKCLFKGVLLFFPGFLVMLIVRRIFGFSYGGFLFFFSLLLRDQLAPLLVALGSFLVMKGQLRVSGVEEESFQGAFSFLAGFLAMVNLADLVRSWGDWNAYLLFLLPTLRLTAVLLLSLVAWRFYPWEGRDGFLFCCVGAALATAMAVPGFLFHINRVGWSIALAVLPLFAAVFSFAMRFPRVVRA